MMLLAGLVLADVVLRGDVTGTDNHTWRLVPFEVPAGTTRITVDFDYDTRDARTTLDLGVMGPEGFRGWSGGNQKSFTLSATDATPSYLAGPIQAGTWNLLLGIPNIRPDTHAEYTASIRFGHEGDGRSPADPVLRAQPGWYRGDLHMHTAHSDGTCLSKREQRVPCPLFLTAQAASERGLDFIAITDHNTVSHAEPIRELQPYYDIVLLIPGREITTFHGHANLFGTVGPLDFRVGSSEVPDWNALLASAGRLGGVVSINHPVRPSGEECMGCGWTARGEVDYSRVQAVEVVNGKDADTPFSGIGFWERLLDRGYELTALGGSDTHDALTTNGGIGVPTTVIYADELSQPGIVAGIHRGRVFIDVAGTRDRSIDVMATAPDGRVAHMGDELRAPRGALVRFDGGVSGVSGGEIQVILDGHPVPLLHDAHVAAASQRLAFTWRADGKQHWLRLDVRDAASHLALLGNPIYLR